MSKSWSNTKKILEQDLLCEKLRGRVSYFLTRYRKSHDEQARIAVLIDGEEVLKGNSFDYYRQEDEISQQISEKEKVPQRKWDGSKILYEKENDDIVRRVEKKLMNDGIVEEYLFSQVIKFYMNNPIEKCIYSENAMVRMFAILDRRVGKRTLQKLKEDVDKQPQWLKQFYAIRFEAENI